MKYCEICNIGSIDGKAHRGDCVSLPTSEEGPPNVDVPLKDQTKESLIAYIESLEKQTEGDEKRRAGEGKALEVAALVLLLDNEQELVLTDDEGSNVPLCGSPLEMKARAIFEEIGWDKYREIISRPKLKDMP